MKKYLCALAVVLCAIAFVSSVQADVWIDDNVKTEGKVGEYYEADLHFYCNDVGAYLDSYGIEENKLPPGIIKGNMGNGWIRIYGTPTKAGKYTFSASANNSRYVGTSKKYTVEIKAKELSITTTSLPGGTVGKYYDADLEASGGVSSWSYTGSLPEGLSLSSISGRISGYPEEAGRFPITVEISSGGITATKDFTIVISESGGDREQKEEQQTKSGPSIYPSDMPSSLYACHYRLSYWFISRYTDTIELERALVGKNKSYKFGVLSDGIYELEFTGVPDWLEQKRSIYAREYAGTPSETGTYEITATASNAYGQDTKKFIIKVGTDPIISHVTLGPSIFPEMECVRTLGETYIKQDEEDGGEYFIGYGTRPMSWEVVKGSLPDGLSLDASYREDTDKERCYLVGTTTKVGKYDFTIRLSNSEGYYDEDFSVTIKEASKEDEPETDTPVTDNPSTDTPATEPPAKETPTPDTPDKPVSGDVTPSPSGGSGGGCNSGLGILGLALVAVLFRRSR